MINSMLEVRLGPMVTGSGRYGLDLKNLLRQYLESKER